MSSTSLTTLFSLSPSSSILVCTVSLPWQWFVEGCDILLMAWTMSSFLGFAPPWLACWDCLKGLFSFVSALSLSWGFKSMDTHTSQCGGSASFTIHFFLGRCSLLLAAASSGLCTCWNHLCHKRYEVLALHFIGGGTLDSWWLRYLRFQVRKFLLTVSQTCY